MREALSRSQRTKSKGKTAAKAAGSTISGSRTKPAKKSLVKKKVKAKSKSVKSVKKAVKARKATPKAIKTIAKKNVTRIAKTKKPSSRIKAAKQATKRNTKEARAVPPAPKRKVSLGRTKLSPLQPEAPRRQLSSAVLRAFEQAVKMFNRRQFAEAKAMFEDLKPRFPNEVEIIARAQTFIQVCDQRLAHTPTLPRNADELYDRGVFALNIGDFTQARTFFEKALRLRPDEPHLLYSLAATHAQTGSHDQAIAYLSRSIQIQPRFRSQALNDSDFSVLRENKQFLALLGLTSPFERLDSRR